MAMWTEEEVAFKREGTSCTMQDLLITTQNSLSIKPC